MTDLASCPSSQESMGGFGIFFDGFAVSGSSTRHRELLALFRTEAKYVKLSLTVTNI